MPHRYHHPARARLGAFVVAALASLPFATVPAAAIAGVPPSADTWGTAGTGRSTLVLYDTTGEYGWLGELYAIAAGNLASHFGTVTAEPAVDYIAGQVEQHTAVIYLGSTYDEPLPSSMLADLRATTKPVLWFGSNIWQLSGSGDTQAAFVTSHGWDPSTSYIDGTDAFRTVTYAGRDLARDPAAGPVLAPHLVAGPVAPSVLATTTCTDAAGAEVACDPIAQTAGTTIPWALRAANLTYVGEVPFSYISEHDRYLAVADLLFDALDPTAPTVRRALVRLEDVSPGTTDPATLRAFADYLGGAGVPFSIAVIPDYEDPNGVYNGGRAEHLLISRTNDATVRAFDDAVRYAIAKGAVLVQHGTTHQWSNVANPYNAASGDDFEFTRARCATTSTAPYTFTSPCSSTDWVVQLGALPGDSATWARDRVSTGRGLFAAAGLPTPAVFETPHYSASAADYAGIAAVYGVRYERSIYFGGQLSGAISGRSIGQLFPYVVHDVYGTTVLPESLGNYEPEWSNNNPPRSATDIVANAAAHLVVRQGVASLFFHPSEDLAQLRAVVEGIRALGYTFVAPGALVALPAALAVSTTALPAGRVGSTYAQGLQATGGTSPYRWARTAGSLPPGLRLGTDGAVTGTPTAVGSWSFTVRVTDSAQPAATATGQVVLTVQPAQLAVTTASLPDARAGRNYSATLRATGGLTPYRWTLAGGSLPDGLTLGTNGTISGRPRAAGTTTVTFRVTDATVPTGATATVALSITVR